MKKLLLTLMALLMSVSLVACGGGDDSEDLSPAEQRIKTDAEIKETVGFNKYEELYRAADAITDDLDARYNAFAKADAYLVEQALFIPTSQQARGSMVARVVPFSNQYAGTGLAEYKYKDMRLQDEIVTAAEYNDAMAKWAAGSGLEDPTRDQYNGPTELTVATSREIQTLDYVITALATDHELNANFVEGLLENDQYGNFVPAIAESYSSNEDGSVWTFNIRKGVKWVNVNGEEYGEVTAHDFVTGMRHGAEFESGTAWLLQGVVEGYLEYMTNGDFSDEAWANVGVKAVDDYTLEYTLCGPTPYFPTMTTYAVLFPISEEFLNSKGVGCALGTPDKQDCQFGTAQADSILYNSAYIMTTFDAKSQTVLTANEAYWDREHVFLDKVTRIYDEGQDPYGIIKGFEQGTYASASLNPAWSDYAAYAEKYAEYARPSLPNASAFGCIFNFNRQTYNNTMHEDDASKANTRAAILNVNFRKALRAAFDKQAYLATRSPEDIALTTIRNINNFPEVVKLSDGSSYGDAVTKAYQAATGEQVSLADAQDAFYNPAAALEYIEAAKKEGINFPVYLDMLVPETAEQLKNQGLSMKDSIEKATNGQIVINLVMKDLDTVQQIAYYNTDPALADYDISTFTGWSPDYADPKSFVDIYSPTTGYYMTPIGLLNNDTINALLAEAAME